MTAWNSRGTYLPSSRRRLGTALRMPSYACLGDSLGAVRCGHGSCVVMGSSFTVIGGHHVECSTTVTDGPVHVSLRPQLAAPCHGGGTGYVRSSLRRVPESNMWVRRAWGDMQLDRPVRGGQGQRRLLCNRQQRLRQRRVVSSAPRIVAVRLSASAPRLSRRSHWEGRLALQLAHVRRRGSFTAGRTR